jgi:hypothetical protein
MLLDIGQRRVFAPANDRAGPRRLAQLIPQCKRLFEPYTERAFSIRTANQMIRVDASAGKSCNLSLDERGIESRDARRLACAEDILHGGPLLRVNLYISTSEGASE